MITSKKKKFASLWCRDFSDALIWYRKGWPELSGFWTYIIIPLSFTDMCLGGSQNKKTGLSFVYCLCPEERDWHPWNFSETPEKASLLWRQDRNANCGNKSIYCLWQEICLRFFVDSQRRTSSKVLHSTNTKQ